MKWVQSVTYAPINPQTGVADATVVYVDGSQEVITDWHQLNALQKLLDKQREFHQLDPLIPFIPKLPFQLSCEDFAAAQGAQWRARRDPFYVYLSCGQRFKIQVEQVDQMGFGYWRDDELTGHGINSSEVDARETAVHIAERMGQQFSLRMLEEIIQVLQASYDEWEVRRQIDMRKRP